MAHAVVAPRYGDPDVLTLVDVDPGSPGNDEVLLEVRAAGVNPADWKAYTGAFGTDPGRLPLRLGYEAAGVVLEAGAGARQAGVEVGSEVIAYPVDGAYAERLVVPFTSVVPKPPSVGWPEAGGMMLTGATATHTLEATGVGAGDTVLVHGASGGVGSMVVQLALIRGAHVVGTARRRHHEDLVRLGVHPVEYGPGLADRVRAVAPGGVDVAIDTVGTDEALDVSVELVADRRRIATIAGFARGPELGVQVLGNGPGADPGTAIRAAAPRTLTALAGEGRLTIRVGATFPLAEVQEAHRRGMAGEFTGKIVLVP